MKLSDKITRKNGIVLSLMSLAALGIEFISLFAFHEFAEGSPAGEQAVLAVDNLFRLIMCFTMTFGSVCFASGLVESFKSKTIKIESALLLSVLLSIAIHYFLFMK